MCGIYGMIQRSGAPLHAPAAATAMRQSLVHRGPDGHGCIRLPHAILGVNRLRIVDRSDRGDQPFTSQDGNVWLALNGEIYNAGDLRRRYPGYCWRSRSDAETVLPLFLDRGPRGLEDLDGMFAIAVWDDRARTLTLARDRAGEKPLFVRQVGDEIWFASEIQALLRAGAGRPGLDRTAFAQGVRLGYIPEPRTPFDGISRVEAGTIATFGPEGDRTTRRYWTVETAPVVPAPRAGDAADELDRLLCAAVRKQLTADVPVGVFASGGLDSSLLLALAAREQPVLTFTVRFHDHSYDEGVPARAVAARFSTRHVEVTARDTDLLGALECVTTRVAEPVADPAVLPTYLLAKVAREHVGVVLSGEGADELFGGYPTYLGHRVAPVFSRIPQPLRAFIRRGVLALPSSAAKVPLEFLLKQFVAAAELPWLDRHLAWFGTGLPAGLLPAELDGPVTVPPGAGPAYRRAMLLDYSTYLRDGLLTKLDRATMLHSLESRSPYLDRDVSRFAFSLPDRFTARGLRGKWLLRRVASRRLPPAVLRRQKRGLSVPVAQLLGGRLEPARLIRRGLLNARTAGELLPRAPARGLWALLVWQRWLDHWMPEEHE
jgi:asparagine synthase (glutamine-hydrolysing)